MPDQDETQHADTVLAKHIAYAVPILMATVLLGSGCAKRSQVETPLEVASERIRSLTENASSPLRLIKDTGSGNRRILILEAALPDQAAYVAFNTWMRPNDQALLIVAEAERADPDNPNIDLVARAEVTLDRLDDGRTRTWVRGDYVGWMRRETRSYTIRLRALEKRLIDLMTP